MAEIIIVQDDRGKTFEVRQEDTIIIRLAENPTTGYQWNIDAVDKSIVKLKESDLLTAPGTGIGGGSARRFTFKAQAPGTTEIQLQLGREWENKDAAIDRFKVAICIQET